MSHPSPAATVATRNAPQGPPKVLLAVHGIGDQIAYETIQSVALRVAAYHGKAITTPLGRFYDPRPGAPDATLTPPFPQRMVAGDPWELHDYILGEAYWAPIPRRVANDRYVLEETRRWGRSIAARVAYRNGTPQNADRLTTVIDEMVETIGVLERLTLIADKAGVFKFDLKKLLVDFVDDVQLVADFGIYRDEILKTFDKAMTDALKVDAAADSVYIVAHSEGTVITFLALLEALRHPDRYTWIAKVRGLMTIGSPIEVHHLLWPQLWQVDAAGNDQSGPAKGVTAKITWHNYMDFGDPIAYELEETTAWLEKSGFDAHLAPITHAFSRYPLPGKAHVDYWTDDDVFGHFLRNVVEKKDTPLQETWREKALRSFRHVRRRVVNAVTQAQGDIESRFWVPTSTFILPYAIVAGLLFVGVYAIELAIARALGQNYPIGRVAFDVLAFGTLLFGVTAAARLPRIADRSRWNVFASGLLLACMAVFGFAITPPTQLHLAGLVGRLFPHASSCLFSSIGVSIACASGSGIGLPVLLVCALAAAVALLSGLWVDVFPRHGHYMLPGLGFVAALLISVPIAMTGHPTAAGVMAQRPDTLHVVLQQGAPAAAAPSAPASLWPVFFGGIVFFYLWWLGAMLFDLSFIWRRYARHSAVREHLAKMPRMVERDYRDDTTA